MRPQDLVTEFHRLCEANSDSKGGCQDDCPLKNFDCGFNIFDCSREKFAEFYNKVEKWSEANPIETRQDKFLRQIPRALVKIDGVLSIGPCEMDNRYLDHGNCEFTSCSECRRLYWTASADKNGGEERGR